jgi:hypothetical protein
MNDDAVRASIQLEYEAAIAIATRARVEFLKRPMIRSKRGGDRTSPWFRIWNESEQNVVRLARLLGPPKGKSRSLDEELSELLGQGS